jgi:hypothetical protein
MVVLLFSIEIMFYFGIPEVGACRPERFADPQQEPAASFEVSEALLVAQEPL